MKTIKSIEILKNAGIFISDERTKHKFLVEFEKELKQYPISCLKNIVHVKWTPAEAIAEMEKYAKENLIQSYNDEKDWQLQNKIAHGLSMCSSIHYCLITLLDPDLSDQQRNEVWKKIIDRWRKEPSDNHKSIDMSHFRDALKARDENERKHGSEQKYTFLCSET